MMRTILHGISVKLYIYFAYTQIALGRRQRTSKLLYSEIPIGLNLIVYFKINQEKVSAID
jgi:hypothetical protein